MNNNYSGKNRLPRQLEYTLNGQATGIELCIDPYGDAYEVRLTVQCWGERGCDVIETEHARTKVAQIMEDLCGYRETSPARKSYRTEIADDAQLEDLVRRVGTELNLDNNVDISTSLYLDMSHPEYVPTPRTREELQYDPVFHILKQLDMYFSEEAFLFHFDSLEVSSEAYEPFFKEAGQKQKQVRSLMKKLFAGNIDDLLRENIINPPEFIRTLPPRSEYVTKHLRKRCYVNQQLAYAERGGPGQPVLHRALVESIAICKSHYIPDGWQNVDKIREQCKQDLSYGVSFDKVGHRDWSKQFDERDSRLLELAYSGKRLFHY